MPLAQLRKAITTGSSSVLRLLPDMLAALQSLERHVISLEREVRRMRQGVESLNGRVDALNEKFDQIEQTLGGVRADLRPWRRSRAVSGASAPSTKNLA